MEAPSREQRGQAGCGGGCILIPCLGQKMGGCHGTLTHLPLHAEALEGRAPAPCCAPAALRDRIPPPQLFHPDSRFPIAVATSGMATRSLLQGDVSHVPSLSLGCPPPRGRRGGCGGLVWVAGGGGGGG